tara:strand:- start:1143 stop:2066 length:924 start_codon:yes stop_codon:yes gene_type:complete
VNNRYLNFKRKIDNKELVILDGGTGTELEKRGVKMDASAWCGITLENDKETLIQIHLDYINAGAEVISANTYASNRIMLSAAGMEDKFHEINFRAIDSAIEARDRTRSDVLVAGSLGHRLPIEVGKQEADIDFSQAELEDCFSEQAMLFYEKGCDLIKLEMMYHPNRIRPAFNAAKKTGLPVWAGFSVRKNKYGEIVNWTKQNDYKFSDTIKILNDFDIDASGIMHSSIDVIKDAINITKENFKGPIMAYPDSGGWISPHWQFDTVINPIDFVKEAKQWKESGVNMIGGCCGIGPEHIKELSRIRDC